MNDEQDIVLDKEEGIDDSVLSEDSARESVKKLRVKLSEAEDKSKDFLDKWQRAQADFVNLRKKDEEAKVDFLKFANTKLIMELLPVLDSLEAALNSPHPSLPLSKVEQTQSASVVGGAEAIYKQFLKILKDQGLEEINPIGEIFNPNLNEAIGMIKTSKKDDDHKILEILQKGYALSGRVLRPAKVKIGEFA